MIRLKSEGNFHIKGRGTAYSINRSEYTVGDMREALEKEEIIIIDNMMGYVKGIESFAIGEPMRSELTTFSVLFEKA